MEGLLESTFSFGNIVVSPQTNVITLAGKQKRLEPRLIALLIYLAQHAQQVITRQQITATIWPDVVVGEESITQAIFALRNALGDDAKNPKYIETIPKKGYRFLAEIAAVSPVEKPPLLAPSRKLRKPTLALITGLVLCGLTLLWYILKVGQGYEIASVLPVTKMSGAECCLAVSNNRKMAFMSILDNQSTLYVKDLSKGTQELVAKDDWQKGVPVWQDNNTLLYPRCLNGECQVVQQVLHQSPQALYSTANYIGEIALAPSRPDLLIINEQGPAGSEFLHYDLRSGKHEKLRNKYPGLPSEMVHPVFSPDASQIYFVNMDNRPMVLMALDLGNAKLQAISDQFDGINSFSFNHQRQLIIAGVYQSTMGLWLLDKAEQQPSLLLRSSGNEHFLFPITDPIEQTIYYQSAQQNTDIGMLNNGQEIADGFAEINATGFEDWATLSDDEQFVYFVSDRTGVTEVWRYDVHKKQSKPITQLKTSLIKLLLPSHNGQRFVAVYIDDRQPRLGVFSVHNGELLTSIASLSHPLSWSPDDQYIYAEEIQGKFTRLVRYDSQTLAATEIEQNAGLFAQESADKQSILFMDLEKNALVKKNMATGEKQTLLDMDINLKELWPGLLRLDQNQSSLLTLKRVENKVQLWRYPFSPSTLQPTKVMDLPDRIKVTFINPEGTKVLYMREMPPSGDIMKVELK